MALMLVVPHALVQWLHLVIIAAILLLTTLGSTCTRAFYRAAIALGLDHQLDLMYLRVREIRRLFAWRLGSGRDHDTAKRSAFALSSPELIEAEGFRCEEHVVTTPDGYILTLHRIVPREDAHGRSAAPRHHAHPEPSCASEPAPFMRISAVNGNGGRGERPPPVLFVHGLMQSSECWLLGGRDASLPMRLADRSDGGPTYDVWLANIRGCFYSQKHLRQHRTLRRALHHRVHSGGDGLRQAGGHGVLARWVEHGVLWRTVRFAKAHRSLLNPLMFRRLRNPGSRALIVSAPQRASVSLCSPLAGDRRPWARALACDGAGGG
jgi:hypothetical protein